MGLLAKLAWVEAIAALGGDGEGAHVRLSRYVREWRHGPNKRPGHESVDSSIRFTEPPVTSQFKDNSMQFP